MDKAALYDDLVPRVAALVAGLDDPVAVMANAAAAIHESLPYASWTGFYRVVAPGLLRVGPFQGPVACVEIPFERGVCGAAATERRTQVVADVDAFPGHIACDSRARSEIVVPILDADGTAIAVLDVDSHAAASFDDADRLGLERIARTLAPHLSPPPVGSADRAARTPGRSAD